jgi:hypothetical protein
VGAAATASKSESAKRMTTMKIQAVTAPIPTAIIMMRLG